MSASRSAQAAQRRRAGPSEASMPGRGPQPSINSAQMFANQARPGNGPNIPSGRLAGQQAAFQQQQQMQQHQQSQKEGLNSVTKMSVPQAITLITLRLGALETKMMNLDSTSSFSTTGDNSSMEMIKMFAERLDDLEKKTEGQTQIQSQDSKPSQELNVLKQQIEMMKQSLAQLKQTTGVLTKDKLQLQKDLQETMSLLVSLQNLTMENSQKLLELSKLNDGCDLDGANEEINYGEQDLAVEDHEITVDIPTELDLDAALSGIDINA